MPDIILSDYLRGDETTQFSFFRVPSQLVSHPRFKGLSADAKLLYGMLLNRMNLSAKNGWHDETGRVYIYYTVKEVCEAIGCGRNKAMRLLAELDTGKGIGLIERVKQGQGRPDRIFVKQITVREDTETPSQDPDAPILQDDFSDIQRSEDPTSSSRKNRPLEVSKVNPSYIEKRNTPTPTRHLRRPAAGAIGYRQQCESDRVLGQRHQGHRESGDRGSCRISPAGVEIGKRYVF